jgi:hypothetical protein
MLDSRKACLVVTALVLLGSCGGVVKGFSVVPNQLCRGDSVIVRWSTKGATRLLALRSEASSEDSEEEVIARIFEIPVGNEGVATFWPDESVEFQVRTVRRGREAYARKAVVVSPSEPWSDTFAVFVVPSGGDSLRGSDTLGRFWQDNIKIRTIWSAEADRPFRIRFRGHEALLTPDGAPSAAFEGMSASGAWEIGCALLPDEHSGSQAMPEIDRIHFGLELSCERGN